MTEPTLVQTVARFAAHARARGIGPELRRDVKRRVLDLLGIAVLASTLEPARIAIAVGDELTVRVGMAGYDRALGNSVFFDKGLHATSIAGTLGAAAAAAMLYGLDEVGIGHAIAIAASMGAGIIEANRVGGSVKRVHCGWAAHAGIAAAELARHGLTGPSSVFEGRFGFLQAYLGSA